MSTGVSSITLPHGANPTLTITIAGAALYTSRIPHVNSFQLAAAVPGVSTLAVAQVSITASQILLTLKGAASAGDKLTLTYTPPVNDAILNIDGERMYGFSSLVTVS